VKDQHVTTQYDLSAQIVAHARAFLGRPYLADGLVGSHDTKEEFVARRDAFDCVTFVETVLAECFSEAYGTSFEDQLRELRYRNGEISWLSRLHYFSDWLETNDAHGRVRAVFPKLSETRRTLSLLSHYPARVAMLRFLPVSELDGHLQHLAPGDLLAFGTTRENLDVSHVGFFAHGADSVHTLLHATKTFGGVVEEPLAAFLTRFGESPGLLVYRPILGGGAISASF
jgi:cell wall-associated NlpC family hydrolase